MISLMVPAFLYIGLRKYQQVAEEVGLFWWAQIRSDGLGHGLRG